MTKLTLRSSLVAAVLLFSACGRPEAPLEQAGEVSQAETPAAAASAATGPAVQEPTSCLPDAVPDDGRCQPAHQVSLTAVAAASSNLTIYAGVGQQPQIRIYVAEQLLGPESTVFFQLSNGPFIATQILEQAPAVDAEGIYYAMALDTHELPESTYQLRAWLGADRTGIPSETLTLVVDRQAPVVTVNLTGLPDGKPAARDFTAGASINATSHTDLAIADIDLEAVGPLASEFPANPPQPWVDFFVALQTEGLPTGVGAGESIIDAAHIPDDQMGINRETNAILFRAVATDVLGNVGTGEVLVAVQ
jgi:hypothetical protein